MSDDDEVVARIHFIWKYKETEYINIFRMYVDFKYDLCIK